MERNIVGRAVGALASWWSGSKTVPPRILSDSNQPDPETSTDEEPQTTRGDAARGSRLVPRPRQQEGDDGDNAGRVDYYDHWHSAPPTSARYPYSSVARELLASSRSRERGSPTRALPRPSSPTRATGRLSPPREHVPDMAVLRQAFEELRVTAMEELRTAESRPPEPSAQPSSAGARSEGGFQNPVDGDGPFLRIGKYRSPVGEEGRDWAAEGSSFADEEDEDESERLDESDRGRERDREEGEGVRVRRAFRSIVDYDPDEIYPDESASNAPPTPHFALHLPDGPLERSESSDVASAAGSGAAAEPTDITSDRPPPDYCPSPAPSFGGPSADFFLRVCEDVLEPARDALARSSEATSNGLLTPTVPFVSPWGAEGTEASQDGRRTTRRRRGPRQPGPGAFQFPAYVLRDNRLPPVTEEREREERERDGGEDPTSDVPVAGSTSDLRAMELRREMGVGVGPPAVVPDGDAVRGMGWLQERLREIEVFQTLTAEAGNHQQLQRIAEWERRATAQLEARANADRTAVQEEFDESIGVLERLREEDTEQQEEQRREEERQKAEEEERQRKAQEEAERQRREEEEAERQRKLKEEEDARRRAEEEARKKAEEEQQQSQQQQQQQQAAAAAAAAAAQPAVPTPTPTPPPAPGAAPAAAAAVPPAGPPASAAGEPADVQAALALKSKVELLKQEMDRIRASGTNQEKAMRRETWKVVADCVNRTAGNQQSVRQVAEGISGHAEQVRRSGADTKFLDYVFLRMAEALINACEDQIRRAPDSHWQFAWAIYGVLSRFPDKEEIFAGRIYQECTYAIPFLVPISGNVEAGRRRRGQKDGESDEDFFDRMCPILRVWLAYLVIKAEMSRNPNSNEWGAVWQWWARLGNRLVDRTQRSGPMLIVTALKVTAFFCMKRFKRQFRQLLSFINQNLWDKFKRMARDNPEGIGIYVVQCETFLETAQRNGLRFEEPAGYRMIERPAELNPDV
ncbi:unnamed protein product [Vitrella brassicaformis CCMP3155]|uniref:mRNA export factor GLE1 n=2 Tax=Vitrella brassicaformis TaxID=1169539 RepID=A0A0G4FEH2_VITBC|nr:unnamed protein product [Vitrella brassicaformis CCMP3155]|eukprot:CEM11599.1 unnamed protein product [Vitrella brassicaformis CCMP3155]